VIEIVEEQKLKLKYPKQAYNIGTLKALFSYRAPKIKAAYDGKDIEVEVMMFSVGNSTTYGGGMKITPKANPRKDFFNITYLNKMSIPTFLWHFPKVFSGKHINVKKRVKNFNAQRVVVDSQPRSKIIADGELLDLLPAEITKSQYKQEIIIP
jgi:diacylglycerol kinase (ATP)